MLRTISLVSIFSLITLNACKRDAPTDLAVVVSTAQDANAPGTVLKSGDRVSRKAGFTFTASNTSTAQSWLMLFLVDAEKRIFWLLPSATPDAQSVPVPNNRGPMRAGPMNLEQAAAGPAQIMALFSDRALPALGVNEQVRVGGYQAVRAIDGATVVQTYPLILE